MYFIYLSFTVLGAVPWRSTHELSPCRTCAISSLYSDVAVWSCSQRRWFKKWRNCWKYSNMMIVWFLLEFCRLNLEQLFPNPVVIPFQLLENFLQVFVFNVLMKLIYLNIKWSQLLTVITTSTSIVWPVLSKAFQVKKK